MMDIIMDALVKNWIELSLILGCKWEGIYFKICSKAHQLSCVAASFVLHCRYKKKRVILQTKNLYTLFSYVDSTHSIVRR